MQLSKIALTAFAALAAAACANAPDAPADLDELDDEAASAAADVDDDGLEATDDAEFVDKASCGGRWQLPSATSSAGNQQSVSYDSPGSRCSGGPTRGAETLGRYLRSAFPDQVDTDVPGDGIQIYACRNVRGGSGLSVHATGRALDVFIPTRGGAADNAKGDRVANWLVENAEHIGVQMIIWDRTIWKASGGVPRDRCYQGQHPHNDHVHVELSQEAASLQTPFFRGEPPTDSGAEDVPADSSQPPSGGDTGTPINRNSWIGDLCRSDNDCGFSADGGRGRCFLDHEPSSGLGFCTLSCAGFCPDKDGKATTFCISGGMLGADAGLCVAKADDENNWCRSPSGFTAVSASRYVGDSGASSRSAEVCLPNGG